MINSYEIPTFPYVGPSIINSIGCLFNIEKLPVDGTIYTQINKINTVKVTNFVSNLVTFKV